MRYNLSKSTITALIIIAIVGSFGTGMVVGERLEKNAGAETTSIANEQTALDLKPLWKTLEVLNEKFVSTTASSTIPSNEDKVYGAIEGLVAAYGDPYTTFFPPKESKAFEEEVQGNFEGVGMEIGIKDNILTVIAPLKNTPADRAGLRAGDQILKIGKIFTAGMTVEDAIDHIRGPKGTTVTFTVKRNGGAEEISVVRDRIEIPTVDTKLRDDGVFVISLYNFSATSPDLFRGALREFILSGADKLILDLRNNPGGYLEAATDMASFFLPAGKVIVTEDSGAKENQKTERSRGYNIFNENLKMAILLNEGSASASEILAGALHEHGIAKLVGEKSYGKGSVQELIEITPDTSLKVTIAKWLTPNGHSLSENGLDPDYPIEFTQKDLEKKLDPQMEKAAEILKDPNFKR